ncbi:unnamed protein product [Callosobruchus maculatus]|uniref:Uncharacterized protein n=1 Tax=Callosobruchus maculatus TaxID=64391 RepID=A0A653BL64_CALMS|nr:unnamed protein product [Callosobruchus maculatus]
MWKRHTSEVGDQVVQMLVRLPTVLFSSIYLQVLS